jgi:cell wall-associated NlpC family hydrolase
MKLLIDYARTFLGTPYIWGGNSPQGYDCSGFVQEVLAFAGVDPKGDQTAQTLYNHFLVHGLNTSVGAGALVFYGSSRGAISHVSMMTGKWTIIEAGGGDSKCITVEIANKKGAFVRERPLSIRKDLVAVLMPAYPEWVKEIV